MTRIPKELPEKTEILDLNDNMISNLNDHAFHNCKQLQSLNISKNNLMDISRLAFLGLSDLRVLSLDSNTLNVSDLLSDVFDPVSELHTLKLHNNTYQGSTSYNGQLFEHLTQLEYLSLDGIARATFTQEFTTLTQIKTLIIKGDQQYIANDTFKAFTNTTLSELRITSNLFDLEEMAFGHLHELSILDLSFNTRLGFHNVSKSWYGLRYTKIQTLLLESTVLYQTDFITINASFYEGLQHTNLKKINLNSNNIILMTSLFSKYTPNLTELYLAYNRLMHVEELIIDASHLYKLKICHAESQNKMIIDPNTYSGPSALELGHRDYWREYKTKSIDFMMQNDANVQEERQYKDHKIHLSIPIPKSLEYINMEDTLNIATFYFPMVIIVGHNKLRYLNYAKNGLEQIIGPFIFSNPPPGLFIMDLSKNGCYFMHPEFGNYSGHLFSELYLGKNQLGSQLSKDVNGTTMKHFTSVKKLDLSYNRILQLKGNVFAQQIHIQTLNISNNYLQVFLFKIDHLRNLSQLDLSGNQFMQIFNTEIFSTQLLNIQEGGNFSLNLTSNPFSCSCDSLSFLKWVVYTDIKVADWQQYTCLYKHAIISLNNLTSDILPNLNIECKSKELLIVSVVAVCLLLIMIAISIVLFRHRFEIKYACLKHVWERTKYERLLENDTYEYDAFVAFHENEFDFVENQLLPHLEEEGPHKLNVCVHYKHFTVGGFIEENIIKAIEQSRKTLLILSKGFLQSEWCEFEYRMARVKAFEKRKNVILPIIMEELPVRDMSKSLCSLLAEASYLEWPNGPEQRDIFWTNLREALK